MQIYFITLHIISSKLFDKRPKSDFFRRISVQDFCTPPYFIVRHECQTQTADRR